MKQQAKTLEIQTGERLLQAENFVQIQTQNNSLLRPFYTAELRLKTVRKLTVAGSTVQSNLFEWPTEDEMRRITLSDLRDSNLKRIDYHVGGSIWSMKLGMSDGRTSPVFGSKNVIDDSQEIDPQIRIDRVEMLSSDDGKYVNAFKLVGKRVIGGHIIEENIIAAEVKGVDSYGTWQTEYLDGDERILGLYGSLNSAPNIRALGFIVWKANFVDQELEVESESQAEHSQVSDS